MRNIEETGNFKRAKRRIEKGGRYRKAIKERFIPALIKLANDIPLDYSYHDHALTGDMEGYRDCHITFDLVLVYKYQGDDVLVLEDIGTHSEVLGV